MRAYWKLTEAQRDDVDSDPAVAAAIAALDAVRAAAATARAPNAQAAAASLSAAHDALDAARDEAAARMFGKETEMKSYSNLTDEQWAQVNRDPKVAAALNDYRATLFGSSAAATTAARYTYTLARDETAACMFGKEESK